MKIIFVAPVAYPNPDPEICRALGWGIGGSEMSLYNVARELSKRGYDVTILSFDSKEEINEEIEGISFKRYPPDRANIRNRDCIFLKKENI